MYVTNVKIGIAEYARCPIFNQHGRTVSRLLVVLQSELNNQVADFYADSFVKSIPSYRLLNSFMQRVRSRFTY